MPRFSGQLQGRRHFMWAAVSSSIHPPDPHFQKPVLQRIGLDPAFLLVGEDLAVQQGGDGVLDGAGRLQRVLLDKGDGGDSGRLSCFGDGH